MECTRDNLILMSNYCLTNNFPEDSECFPYLNSTRVYSQITGGWCIFNAIIGFFGNLLTLLSIPFAAKHNKFGLSLGCPTTIFTLNLALADFLYCAIHLPLYALQYLMGGWPGTLGSCKALAAFRYTNAIVAGMSIALIAISRCAMITRFSICKKLLSGWTGLVFLILVWIYPSALLWQVYSERIGEFGYNCLSGVCEFLPSANSSFHSRMILYGTAFIIIGVLTLASYLIMGCYVFFNPQVNLLKNTGTNDLRKMLYKRERQLAKTLLAVCTCYFLFVVPQTILNIMPHDPMEKKEDSLVIYLAVFSLYWLQYSANFFIYAARCDQFQKAYTYFLESLMSCIFGEKNRNVLPF